MVWGLSGSANFCACLTEEYAFGSPNHTRHGRGRGDDDDGDGSITDINKKEWAMHDSVTCELLDLATCYMMSDFPLVQQVITILSNVSYYAASLSRSAALALVTYFTKVAHPNFLYKFPHYFLILHLILSSVENIFFRHLERNCYLIFFLQNRMVYLEGLANPVIPSLGIGVDKKKEGDDGATETAETAEEGAAPAEGGGGEGGEGEGEEVKKVGKKGKGKGKGGKRKGKEEEKGAGGNSEFPFTPEQLLKWHESLPLKNILPVCRYAAQTIKDIYDKYRREEAEQNEKKPVVDPHSGPVVVVAASAATTPTPAPAATTPATTAISGEGDTAQEKEKGIEEGQQGSEGGDKDDSDNAELENDNDSTYSVLPATAGKAGAADASQKDGGASYFSAASSSASVSTSTQGSKGGRLQTVGQEKTSNMILKKVRNQVRTMTSRIRDVDFRSAEERECISRLRKISFIGVLPVPPAIELKKYSENAVLRKWMRELAWRIAYYDVDYLWDANSIVLFPAMPSTNFYS